MARAPRRHTPIEREPSPACEALAEAHDRIRLSAEAGSRELRPPFPGPIIQLYARSQNGEEK